MPQQQASLSRFVLLGDVIPSPFVEAVEAVQPRGGRIDPVLLVTNDGAFEVVAGFDNKLGESVQLFTRTDGIDFKMHFGPEALAFTVSDDGCVGQVRGRIATKSARTARCPIHTAIDPVTSEHFEVTGELTEREERERLSSCPDAANPTSKVFAVGERIDVTKQFVEARSVPIGSGRIKVLAHGPVLDTQGVNGSFMIAEPRFFDSELGFSCAFSALPNPATAMGTTDADPNLCEPALRLSEAFADKACTQPAIFERELVNDVPNGKVISIDHKPFAVVGSRGQVFSMDAASSSCVPSEIGFALKPVASQFVRATAIERIE